MTTVTKCCHLSGFIASSDFLRSSPVKILCPSGTSGRKQLEASVPHLLSYDRDTLVSSWLYFTIRLTQHFKCSLIINEAGSSLIQIRHEDNSVVSLFFTSLSSFFFFLLSPFFFSLFSSLATSSAETWWTWISSGRCKVVDENQQWADGSPTCSGVF